MAITDKNILSFTNQDYESILEEIKLTKKELMPEYTDDSDTDFGNLILTYVAMLFDVLSWKMDYSVNESIPALAQTIKAMYKHCKWIGYKPQSNRASKTTFEITITNTGQIQSLSKGFKVTMEYQVNGNYIIYELDDNVTCKAPEGVEIGETYTVQVNGTQGESVSETIGYSNGKVDQDFYITYAPYIEGSLTISCYNPTTGKYEYYLQNENNSFVGTTSKDKVIVLEQVDSSLIKVRFGDGYNGKIPEDGCQLIANYRIGGGVIGNRPAHTIKVPISDMPANFVSIENITEATGGVDADNVEDIKQKISKGRHKTIYALMSKQDFDNFLYNRSDVIERFYVCQDNFDDTRLMIPIAIYLKPKNALTFDEEYKNSLLQEMNRWKLIDDIINIYDCTPVYVRISLKVKSDGLTIESQLMYAIKYAIKDYIDTLDIGNREETVGLFIDDVRNITRQIEGISRFISMDIMEIKYDNVSISSNSTQYSERASDIVLTKGQLLCIEDLETDITVEFV